MALTLDDLIRQIPELASSRSVLAPIFANNTFDGPTTSYVNNNEAGDNQRQNEFGNLFGGSLGYSHDPGSYLYSLRGADAGTPITIGGKNYQQVSTDQVRRGLNNYSNLQYDPNYGLITTVDNPKADKGTAFERMAPGLAFSAIMAGGATGFGGEGGSLGTGAGDGAAGSLEGAYDGGNMSFFDDILGNGSTDMTGFNTPTNWGADPSSWGWNAANQDLGLGQTVGDIGGQVAGEASTGGWQSLLDQIKGYVSQGKDIYGNAKSIYGGISALGGGTGGGTGGTTNSGSPDILSLLAKFGPAALALYQGNQTANQAAEARNTYTPNSSSVNGTTTLDPRIDQIRQQGLTNNAGLTTGVKDIMSGTNTRLNGLYDEAGGNQNDFIKARVAPLEAQLATRRGDLLQSNALRKIQGSSFGDQAITNFDTDAGRALGDARSLATNDSINSRLGISNNISNQGITGTNALNTLNNQNFDTAKTMSQQELAALGLPQATIDAYLKANQAKNDLYGRAAGSVANILQG